jgi:hypothetical protein
LIPSTGPGYNIQPGPVLSGQVNGDLIRVEDLDARLYQKKETDEPRTLKEIDDYLEGIKKQMVSDAVKSTRTKAEAARKLNIPPNGLRYFEVKYGL